MRDGSAEITLRRIDASQQNRATVVVERRVPIPGTRFAGAALECVEGPLRIACFVCALGPTDIDLTALICANRFDISIVDLRPCRSRPACSRNEFPNSSSSV